MKTAHTRAGRRHTTRRVTATRQRRLVARHSRMAARLRQRHLAWYAGLGVMAAIEVVEWPLALLMMLGHEIAQRAHTAALRDFAEGIQAGA